MLDRSAARGPLGAAVRAACAGGVDWVQVRDRALEARDLLALADEVRRAAGDGVAVVVNRRADVALAAGAQGVHLGFDGMPAADARALLGPEALVGVSLHDPAEVARARDASYVHLAPVHDPRSKPATRPPLGEDALRAASAHGVAVLAQGGLTAANAGAAVAAGAAGVAVTGAILQADDPGRAARALREALDAAA